MPSKGRLPPKKPDRPGFIKRATLAHAKKKSLRQLRSVLAQEEYATAHAGSEAKAGGRADARAKKNARNAADRRIEHFKTVLDALPGTHLEKIALIEHAVSDPRLLMPHPDFKRPPNILKLAMRRNVPARHLPLFIKQASSALLSAEKSGISRSRLMSSIGKEHVGLAASKAMSDTAEQMISRKEAAESRTSEKAVRKLRKYSAKLPNGSVDWEHAGDESLALVHLTGHVPKDGILYPTSHYDKTGSGRFRDTIHFSLNGPVGSHMYGDWGGKKVAIHVPYEKAKPWIYNAYTIDTFGIGPMKLPHGSHIIVSTDTAKQEGIGHGQKMGGARVHVIDVDKQREKLLAKGKLDKETLEGYYIHKLKPFARLEWERDGRPGDFEEYFQDLKDFRFNSDADLSQRASRHMGIPEGVRIWDPRGALEDHVLENPKQICEFYGVKDAPKRLEKTYMESPFHDAIEDFLRNRGVPVKKSAMWSWDGYFGNDRGLSKKFEKDGFVSQSPHTHTHLDALESGSSEISRVLDAVEAAKAQVRRGVGGDRQARLIDSLGRRIVSEIKERGSATRV